MVRDVRVLRVVVGRDVDDRGDLAVVVVAAVVVKGGATARGVVDGGTTSVVVGTAAGATAATGATGASLVRTIWAPAPMPTANVATASAPAAHERISHTVRHRAPDPRSYRPRTIG